MNNALAELMRFSDEMEAELVQEIMKLITEDAPKNKFSVITGKLRMIEQYKLKIDAIDRENSVKD